MVGSSCDIIMSSDVKKYLNRIIRYPVLKSDIRSEFFKTGYRIQIEILAKSNIRFSNFLLFIIYYFKIIYIFFNKFFCLACEIYEYEQFSIITKLYN